MIVSDHYIQHTEQRPSLMNLPLYRFLFNSAINCANAKTLLLSIYENLGLAISSYTFWKSNPFGTKLKRYSSTS